MPSIISTGEPAVAVSIAPALTHVRSSPGSYRYAPMPSTAMLSDTQAESRHVLQSYGSLLLTWLSHGSLS